MTVIVSMYEIHELVPSLPFSVSKLQTYTNGKDINITFYSGYSAAPRASNCAKDIRIFL